jgi:hypothetical protein
MKSPASCRALSFVLRGAPARAIGNRSGIAIIRPELSAIEAIVDRTVGGMGFQDYL